MCQLLLFVVAGLAIFILLALAAAHPVRGASR